MLDDAGVLRGRLHGPLELERVDVGLEGRERQTGVGLGHLHLVDAVALVGAPLVHGVVSGELNAVLVDPTDLLEGGGDGEGGGGLGAGRGESNAVII